MPRFLLASLAVAVAALAQQPQPPQARIKIDTDRTIAEVHPHIFGNFAEHLGRMIYGGIFEENSPLSDKDGYRTDVMKAVKDLGVSILRYPGGNFVSGYNWKDGIGPRNQRPTRVEMARNDLESNRFGTDEFLQYCERIGAEPYICINAGLGTIDEARQWVEYTNESRDTYWAAQRRKNGRDKPYAVKYWGLGNEIDGPWQLGHKNAEDYSKFALEAAKAMRLADRSIKLIASGSSNFGADWVHWNRTVLETLRNSVDYISLHTYIGNRDNNLERFLGESQANIDKYIDITAGLIREVQSRSPNPRPIYIAYDEWNVWYRGHPKLEEIYNAEDALAMGVFLNAFFRHADTVKMANMAQLVNVIAPIFTSKEGMFLQPIYFPLMEYGRQRGNTAIQTWVSSPKYTVAAEGRGPQSRPARSYSMLDVSTTYNPKDKTVYLNVLNRSASQDVVTRVENQEGRINPSVDVWEIRPTDLKAVHTFGDDRKVRPVTRKTDVALSGNGFNYSFPAHSLTILKMKIQ